MTEDVRDTTAPQDPDAESSAEPDVKVPAPRMQWWQRDSTRQMLALPPAFLALLVPENPQVRLLVVWDVYALTYLLLTWLTFRRRDQRQIPVLARATHRTNRAARFFGQSPRQIPQSAAAMAMIAVVSVLPQARDANGPSVFVLVVCALAVVTSWVMLQVGYMLIYAALYADGGGLAFPGGEEPHLVDFGYFAVAVGTTFGSSDVEVTQRRVRRHVLTHGVLAFLFNTLIVAIAVSVSAAWIAAG